VYHQEEVNEQVRVGAQDIECTAARCYEALELLALLLSHDVNELWRKHELGLGWVAAAHAVSVRYAA